MSETILKKGRILRKDGKAFAVMPLSFTPLSLSSIHNLGEGSMFETRMSEMKSLRVSARILDRLIEGLYGR
jgi:hypothetical protein